MLEMLHTKRLHLLNDNGTVARIWSNSIAPRETLLLTQFRVLFSEKEKGLELPTGTLK